jgi:adenylylsulfate kinase-like enzyme
MVCEQRDPKGLYKKTPKGAIKNFTGIDSAYEAPIQPDLVINTHLDAMGEALGVLKSIFLKL